jgi:hypothetical protein
MNGIRSKAIGDDGISIEILKMIFEFVAEPIKHLNLSIRQRKFTNSWKRSIVVSIPKKNVVLSLSDLRSISGVEDRGEGDILSVYEVFELS